MLNPMAIKIRLLRKGISVREIGRRAGVTNPAISYTIHRKVKGRHLRAAIADALDLPYEKVWGKEKEKSG